MFIPTRALPYYEWCWYSIQVMGPFSWKWDNYTCFDRGLKYVIRAKKIDYEDDEDLRTWFNEEYSYIEYLYTCEVDEKCLKDDPNNEKYKKWRAFLVEKAKQFYLWVEEFKSNEDLFFKNRRKNRNCLFKHVRLYRDKWIVEVPSFEPVKFDKWEEAMERRDLLVEIITNKIKEEKSIIIQRQFRKCAYNPEYKMCRNIMRNHFEDLTIKN